jgi:hypothetical protein
MNETRLNDSWNSQFETSAQDREVTSFVSPATPYVATQPAMSTTTFSNDTVYTSRATSCGVTQLLVAPRSLAWQKKANSLKYSSRWVIFIILF